MKIKKIRTASIPNPGFKRPPKLVSISVLTLRGLKSFAIKKCSSRGSKCCRHVYRTRISQSANSRRAFQTAKWRELHDVAKLVTPKWRSTRNGFIILTCFNVWSRQNIEFDSNIHKYVTTKKFETGDTSKENFFIKKQFNIYMDLEARKGRMKLCSFDKFCFIRYLHFKYSNI